MVGSKLSSLKKEIEKYIGIPYLFGGKSDCKEIALKTIEFANQEKVDILSLTPQQIYNFQKKHHIGLDCSGFASHLLDFLAKLQKKPNIFDSLIGTENKKGVRRLSANLLTTAPNAHLIKDINKIKTGDLIRTKNGHHVLFVIEKKKNIIFFADSSRFRKGVRYGKIEITPKNKNNLKNSTYRLFFFD